MAKIQFGSIVTDMRNKLDNQIYSRNRGGAYVKAYAIPANPDTAYQQLYRGYFASVAAQWQGITEAQRQTWLLNCEKFPVIDNLSNKIILSGWNLFIRLNQNLTIAGQSTIATCPQKQGTPLVSGFYVTADTGSGQLLLHSDLASIPTGYTGILFMTAGYSPTINYFRKYQRLLTTLANGSTFDGLDITATWLARFAGVAVGNKIASYFYLINNSTGEAGVRYTNVAIIT